MFLATLLWAALLQSQPINLFDESYSVETKSKFEAYLACFAKGAYDRRQSGGSPEVHQKEAKAACQKEYDGFVAGVVRDSKGSTGEASAASRARSFLDQMDALASIEPPAPAQLANLPVRGFVGDWRLGSGPLAVEMTVQFSDDGYLVGTLKPSPVLPSGLQRWNVSSNGTKHAVLHAFFADMGPVEYHAIPSFPSEMDFINPADPKVQRIDLTIEDGDLLVRLVTPDTGEQYRFRRQAAP